ncbi:hypothetical protein [Kribbella sp. NPDC051620]|uniref:hypothetical protein n=1 Tax=Kribbella sp. NPDC051620 TaxID=3364120 RepID=UPI0037AB3F30
MGDRFQVLADIDATPDEAPALAASMLRWLVDSGIVVGERTQCVLGGDGYGYEPGPAYYNAVTTPDPELSTLITNGLELDVGRTVFYSSDDLSSTTCPYCGFSRVVAEDVWDEISRWYAGNSGPYRCPACQRAVDLNDLRWMPPWGFGYLGFTFWNWPLLADRFVESVATRLGHRVVRPRGKV